MVFAPIDREMKRSVRVRKYESRKKPKSVFQENIGYIHLYMDDVIVRSARYTSKGNRKQILNGWEMHMKNFYGKHTFYIHVVPETKNNK